MKTVWVSEQVLKIFAAKNFSLNIAELPLSVYGTEQIKKAADAKAPNSRNA